MAIAVAEEARQSGVARIGPDLAIAAEVDAARWWPAYVPYSRARDRRDRRHGVLG